AAVRTIVPIGLRGAEVDALAVLRLLLTGVVDAGVLDDVVRTGRTEVHRLVVGVGHLDVVDHRVVRAVEHDSLLDAGDREAGEVPVRGTVEVQAVPAAVDQHRLPRAGQRDRRVRRATRGGDELA